MTILRSDLHVAVNSLLTACQEASGRHQMAAEICVDGPLAKQLRDLSELRDKSCQALTAFLQQYDKDPVTSDPDKESAVELWLTTKAAFSGNEVELALEVSRKAEEHLIQAANAVTECAVDGELGQIVDAIACESATIERMWAESLTSKDGVDQ